MHVLYYKGTIFIQKTDILFNEILKKLYTLHYGINNIISLLKNLQICRIIVFYSSSFLSFLRCSSKYAFCTFTTSSLFLQLAYFINNSQFKSKNVSLY